MAFLSDLLAAFHRAMFSGGSRVFSLLLVVWLAGRLLARRGSPGERARKVAQQKRALYSAPHEFAPVRARDFPWLDAAFYDATQRWLESVGFRCFGDLENVSLSAVSPEMRTAIRDLASGDGVVSASIWQVKMRGGRRVAAIFRLRKGDRRVVDFVTEFSDGTFLSTSNNREFASTSPVPGLERLPLPEASPIEDALVAHRRRVAEILTRRPGITALLVRTAKDLRSSAARAHALKCGEHARHPFLDLPQFAVLAKSPAAR